MKSLNFLALLAALILLGCRETTAPVATQETTSPAARDGVFIHITECYDDPHRVLMPLKMATMMAEDKDVIVYMDIHSVNLLVKGAKDIEYADFESAHTYIRKLIDMKVGVYACPTCLKIAGYEPADLMEGIQPANKDRFFDFTKGRIITLDY
ncbi:MAG: DsrE family protein [Bacteroidales bacterium]|jgi:predicted peroxiredoxin|nr:DsrE family protein [Bacteroidales bacterium]MCU0408597.1 DsrE family protein [Bacteroidales bacterium]